MFVPVKTIPVLFLVLLFFFIGGGTVGIIKEFHKTDAFMIMITIACYIIGAAIVKLIINRSKEYRPLLGISNTAWFLSLGIGFATGALLVLFT